MRESGAQIVVAMNAVVMGMMVIVSIMGMPVMMLVVIAQQDGVFRSFRSCAAPRKMCEWRWLSME